MGQYLPKPITQKKFHSRKTDRVKYTVCQMQGWRREMEDAAICEIALGDGNSLFAVFDGHSGNQVSQYVGAIFKDILVGNCHYKRGDYEKAMVQTFETVDKILRSDEGEQELAKLRKQRICSNYIQDKQNECHKIGESSGCTANVVLITPLVYVVANSGDSRSVLCRKGKTIQLSYDHKPDNASEYDRIYSAGAKIISGRVNGILNLSRGFGDFRFKNKDMNFHQTAITCMPDVRIFSRSPQDQFILIACDGVFERHPLDSTPVINYVKKERRVSKNGEKVLGKMFDKLLAKDVRDIFGCDNMTAILIEF